MEKKTPIEQVLNKAADLHLTSHTDLVSIYLGHVLVLGKLIDEYVVDEYAFETSVLQQTLSNPTHHIPSNYSFEQPPVLRNPLAENWYRTVLSMYICYRHLLSRPVQSKNYQKLIFMGSDWGRCMRFSCRFRWPPECQCTRPLMFCPNSLSTNFETQCTERAHIRDIIHHTYCIHFATTGCGGTDTRRDNDV